MRTGYVAIGLAAAVGAGPASFAADSRVLGQGRPVAAGFEAQERQKYLRAGNNAGISLAVPIGRVWVGPEFVDGEPIYVRRTTVREGMTIVEVSTTPFTPVLAANEEFRVVDRPDQPASW